ncbi:MAG: transposase [Ornithinimicrobium sp.]
MEVLHAYTVKEDLRSLLSLAGTTPDREVISHLLYRFYDNGAASRSPEIHRLAATIETWWPAIEAAITTGHTNSKSEGYNRLPKHHGRNAFGVPQPHQPNPPHTLVLYPPAPANHDQNHPGAWLSSKSRFAANRRPAISNALHITHIQLKSAFKLTCNSSRFYMTSFEPHVLGSDRKQNSECFRLTSISFDRASNLRSRRPHTVHSYVVSWH